MSCTACKYFLTTQSELITTDTVSQGLCAFVSSKAVFGCHVMCLCSI